MQPVYQRNTVTFRNPLPCPQLHGYENLTTQVATLYFKSTYYILLPTTIRLCGATSMFLFLFQNPTPPTLPPTQPPTPPTQPSTPTTQPPTPPTQPTTPTPTTEPPKTTEGGTNPSCPTTDPSKLCTREGFIIDPCDPRVFYMCIRFGDIFIAYHFECGAGTVFDPSINVCNWPKNVPK
jgi:hypothetical protein